MGVDDEGDPRIGGERVSFYSFRESGEDLPGSRTAFVANCAVDPASSRRAAR
jgi:hypothetical protein